MKKDDEIKLMIPELKEKLERILFRLVKAQVQESMEDLPAAAYENRQLAILALHKLLPDYKFDDEDYRKELEEINEIWTSEPIMKTIYDNL